MAGFDYDGRLSGMHAPNFLVTDCDVYIKRKLSSMGNTLHVHVEEEE